MKFLSVLCVALYLQCGVSVQGHKNDPNTQYTTQTNNFIAQRNADAPLNFESINPSEMNWQREEEKQRNYPNNRDGQFISQDSYGSKINFPEYGNFQEVRNINDPSVNRESSKRLLEELRQHQFNSNVNSYHNIRSSSFINDNRETNKQPVIPRDLSRTLLDSSEYRNQQSVQNSALARKQREETALGIDSSYVSTQPLQLLNNPSLRFKDDDLLKSQLHYSEYMMSQPIQETKPVPVKLEEDMFPTVTGFDRSIDSKSISHEPEEEIKLELQGVSPEYIQSLINKNNQVQKKLLQNSFQNNNEPEGLKGLYNHHYIKKSQLDNEPKPQNPSAEILYKMQKALPYDIQLSNEGISGVNHVSSQDTNKSMAPRKRFTIIHPDGRIEHVDQIETIIENNPNYVMIKSRDILKHLEERSNTFSRPLIPYINQYANSVINQAQKEENYNFPSTVTQKLPVVKKPVPYADGRLMTSPENQVITLPNNINNPNVAPLEAASEIVMNENNPLASLIVNNATRHSAHQNISQNNILGQNSQNITDDSLPTPLNLTESPKTNDVIDKLILNDSISDLNITDSIPRLTFNTSEFAISQLLSQQNINQTLSSNAVLVNAQIPPGDSAATQKDNITNVTTTNNQTSTEPAFILNKNCTIEPESTKFVNYTNTDLNTSTINETYSSISPNMENNTNTGFWFQADERFWESLLSKNGTQNQFYFLFMPPKPSTEKDTRTTVYPNGTTIEEVIETVDKDGVPTIFRTTKITYANNTSGAE